MIEDERGEVQGWLARLQLQPADDLGGIGIDEALDILDGTALAPNYPVFTQ